MSNVVLNQEARDAILLSPTRRTKLDVIRGDKLVELAHDRFDPLTTDAEIEVLRVSASVVDPDLPKEGSKQQVIRPEFLRWLATDPDAAACIAPKGIRAFYVTVPGVLDFYGYRFTFPMMFWLSQIQGDIILQSAETQDFFVMNSEVNGAIIGDRVNVQGSCILRSSKIWGGMYLGAARIKGDLDCGDAEFYLRDASKERIDQGNPIVVDYAEIGGSVVCKGGFVSDGGVWLGSSKVGKDLLFFRSRLGSLDCRGLQLGGEFQWLRIEAVKGGEKKDKKSNQKSSAGREAGLDVTLNLSNASIGNLRDDWESWPSPEKLTLDGCTYKGLIRHKSLSPKDAASDQFPDPDMPTAGERIDWLMRQSEDDRKKLQPWLQLASYLDLNGQQREAKHVRYRLKRQDGPAFSSRRARVWNPGLRSDLGDIASALHHLPNGFRHPIRSFLVAFAWLEEAPFRILWSIGLVLFVGTVIFWNAAAHRVMAPTDEKAYEAFDRREDLPGTYPKLNPFIYTLENAVPLAKMGLDEKWAPNPRGGSHDVNSFWNSWLTNYGFLRTVRWLLILSGWFQAAVLAAALSGLFKD